jgi:hypothetical protein
MKRRFAFFGALVILASLSSLFGCNTQEESKTKSAVPAGAPDGSAAAPGKKGQPGMPGP